MSIEEAKAFYKMMLAPTMTLDDKMDELYDLSVEDLNLLLNEYVADEDYELCHAIKEPIEAKKSDSNS